MAAKEQRFVGCSVKTCCEVETVHLEPGEVERIAAMLGVAPAAFAIPRDDGHVLAHRDAGPCVFLLRLRDGQPRCGLGSARPAPCLQKPVAHVCACVAEAG